MANIVWGINNVGWHADTISVITESLFPGSNEVENIAAGPRSVPVRTRATTGTIRAEMGYTVENYATTPVKFLEASHIFLSRWDKVVNHLYSNRERMYVRYYDYPAAAFANFIDYNDISSYTWNLLGPYQQDWVAELNGGAVQVSSGFSFQSRKNAGTESWASEHHHIVFSNPWDPGTGPVLNPQPQWTPLGTDAVFQPPRAARHYEVEAEITLSWTSITDAKRDELYTYYGGDDCLLNWPFFLYDESQTLWNHKLEHVILADYQWAKRGDGYNNLTCKFYRLRHYA